MLKINAANIIIFCDIFILFINILIKLFKLKGCHKWQPFINNMISSPDFGLKERCEDLQEFPFEVLEMSFSAN